MKSVRRIAFLMIFMLIAPSIWAMSCVTACDMESMHANQTLGAADTSDCCHNELSNCDMATACHFAFSAALFSAKQSVPAIQGAHFVPPIASAPRSADSPPPYKPPA